MNKARGGGRSNHSATKQEVGKCIKRSLPRFIGIFSQTK